MKHTPMLFSTPMVLAILSGQKTKTRRAAKDSLNIRAGMPQPEWDSLIKFCSPYGQPGDRIWVKETYYAWGRWETRFNAKKSRDEWHFVDMTLECGKAYQYLAGNDSPPPSRKRDAGVTPGWWKRPAIFMPRHASRIELEVTGVRVERLQDISRGDAVSEGCPFQNMADGPDPRAWYADLWAQLNGPDSWPANPWVWVVEFKRIKTE